MILLMCLSDVCLERHSVKSFILLYTTDADADVICI